MDFLNKSGIVPNINRKLVKCLLIWCCCSSEDFPIPLEIFVLFISLFCWGDGLAKSCSAVSLLQIPLLLTRMRCIALLLVVLTQRD